MKKSTLACIALLFAGCSQLLSKDIPPQTVALISPDEEQAIHVQVEIADTPEQRSQGLMNRVELPEGTGMMFLFDKPDILTFWMKDTLIPLDILFFDSAGRWVSQATMEPCTTTECPRTESERPAHLAIEVNKGFIERYKTGSGWRIGLPIVEE